MRALILLTCLILSAPALAADTPAYDQRDAVRLKAEAIAFSNSASVGCMTCAATHQAQMAAFLAQYQAQCVRDFSANPEMLAKCQAFWNTYYLGQ